MKNLTFNSKETYLVYRSAWKAEYKTLSHEIRVLRRGIGFHQRHVLCGLDLSEPQRNCLAQAAILCGPDAFSTGLADYRRRQRSNRATEMLEELCQAKREAQRQYHAQKSAV